MLLERPAPSLRKLFTAEIRLFAAPLTLTCGCAGFPSTHCRSFRGSSSPLSCCSSTNRFIEFEFTRRLASCYRPPSSTTSEFDLIIAPISLQPITIPAHQLLTFFFSLPNVPSNLQLSEYRRLPVLKIFTQYCITAEDEKGTLKYIKQTLKSEVDHFFRKVSVKDDEHCPLPDSHIPRYNEEKKHVGCLYYLCTSARPPPGSGLLGDVWIITQPGAESVRFRDKSGWVKWQHNNHAMDMAHPLFRDRRLCLGMRGLTWVTLGSVQSVRQRWVEYRNVRMSDYQNLPMVRLKSASLSSLPGVKARPIGLFTFLLNVAKVESNLFCRRQHAIEPSRTAT